MQPSTLVHIFHNASEFLWDLHWDSHGVTGRTGAWSAMLTQWARSEYQAENQYMNKNEERQYPANMISKKMHWRYLIVQRGRYQIILLKLTILTCQSFFCPVVDDLYYNPHTFLFYSVAHLSFLLYTHPFLACQSHYVLSSTKVDRRAIMFLIRSVCVHASMCLSV